MSDQADSLRQLVRAQRQWREFTPQKHPVVDSRPPFPDDSTRERGSDDDRPRIRGIGLGVFMARAARWAFARAGVRGE
jgi:hypothetical protein